jgi:phosphoribosylformylglycinamidine synthase subunit PurQ / glutaminase
MAKPSVLILRAPGTNCDVETSYAFEAAGAEAASVHVQRLIERPNWAEKFQILCIPGGFSFGDDIAAGRILATEIRRQLADVLDRFVQEDRLILGICNGFQVLMRLGVFFGSDARKSPATLTWNASGRFVDRWVHLAATENECPFLQGIERMYLPIAHAEGRVVFRDDSAAEDLGGAGQLPLRYTDVAGEAADVVLAEPANPNGAALNVAGMCDPSGRIFGLMPHPERHLFATHHPFWTRRSEQPEHGDGHQIFANAVQYFA